MAAERWIRTSDQVHSGQMRIRHLGMAPSVHPEAYVAPTAVLSGDVRIGAGSCIMHGAVLAAEGGPVQIGVSCVIMENAVLRGTPQNPLIMGDHVLAGPHSHLTGCGIADEVFIATGARVFNGAQLGRASSVALGGTVHIGAVLPPLARVPIGWVALGEPAAMYPPGDAEAIRAALDTAGGGFLPFVFGIEEAAGRREQMQAALQRYTAAIARQHHHDEIIDATPADLEPPAAGRGGVRPLPVVLAVRDFLALFEHVFFGLVVGNAGWRRGLVAILDVMIGILVVGVLVLGVAVGAGCHGCESCSKVPGTQTGSLRRSGKEVSSHRPCGAGRALPLAQGGREYGQHHEAGQGERRQVAGAGGEQAEHGRAAPASRCS
jgi:carbonic anhydrase/acetyltransferase-like protein (isoleucine patch superfamily)